MVDHLVINVRAALQQGANKLVTWLYHRRKSNNLAKAIRVYSVANLNQSGCP